MTSIPVPGNRARPWVVPPMLPNMQGGIHDDNRALKRSHGGPILQPSCQTDGGTEGLGGET